MTWAIQMAVAPFARRSTAGIWSNLRSAWCQTDAALLEKTVVQLSPMTASDVFFGPDPGDDRGFGVAMLMASEVKAATVSTVAAAVEWVIGECGSRTPIAAGIDTLLHWCDGPGGWRPADKKLGAAYPMAQSSVLSPNGLYGSMSIGGMALALRLRQRWSTIWLNETHPNVLAFALRGERHADDDPAAAIAWFAKHVGLDLAGTVTGHE